MLLYVYVKTPYLTQQAFTCSKSTIETLEKSLKYVQSYQWRYQKDVIEVVLVSSLLTLNYFKSFSSFPIVDFEQVNIWWENYLTFYSFDISFNVPTEHTYNLYIKYNTIKSYHSKSAMAGKKGETESRFIGRKT